MITAFLVSVYLGGLAMCLWTYIKNFSRPTWIVIDVLLILAWPAVLLAYWLCAEDWRPE